MKFFLLIHVNDEMPTMPTIVGISTFMRRKIALYEFLHIYEQVEHEIFFIISGPGSVMYFQDFLSQFFGIFFFQESKYPWSFNFEYSLSFSLTTNVKEVFL